MRTGPVDGAAILLIPPLFEEMNRTRALLVSVMLRLGGQGFNCWLPDLPGTGESERPLESCVWSDWTGAVRTVAELAREPRGSLMIASVRGGALLDEVPDAAHWRFAPVEGGSLLRDLSRSGLVGGEAHAGYMLSPSLAAAVGAAVPPDAAPCRTVRLASDPKPADKELEGPALWRRSEPANSTELAELIASDIGNWAHVCGVC
jgi:pimeloyl-ACP methyl ester carboxylesterase